MHMLSSNLFRALHPLKGHDAESFDLDEEEPALEPAWPHLQVGGWVGAPGPGGGRRWVRAERGQVAGDVLG